MQTYSVHFTDGTLHRFETFTKSLEAIEKMTDIFLVNTNGSYKSYSGAVLKTLVERFTENDRLSGGQI